MGRSAPGDWCATMGFYTDVSIRAMARGNMGRMSSDLDDPGEISTRLVSFSSDAADLPGINDYDSFAEGYAVSNEDSLVNAYYERPAMLALAGDVIGRRVLDAGCGSGALLKALRDRGAVVTGMDKSAGMLELARRRLGGDGPADLQVAELGRPLPFPDDTFTTSRLPWFCITWRTGDRR
jgi:SAM-dependent methyltransferase